MAGAGLEPLRRAFGPDDLRAVLAGTPVLRTVLVQAVGTLEETRELLAAAAASDGLIAGVVGWVDLTGDVAGAVAELRAGPGGDRLVGVRHQAEDEPDPQWLMRAEVRRGLATLADANLVYDLLVRPPQLEAAVRVVRALPQLRFVLDHGGKPPIAAGDVGPWRAHVRALASSPNVTCKLSGLVTEACRPRDALPFARELLARFGPESDWPVCTLAASYADVLDLPLESLDGLAPGERDAVLSGTAARVYGLL